MKTFQKFPIRPRKLDLHRTVAGISSLSYYPKGVKAKMPVAVWEALKALENSSHLPEEDHSENQILLSWPCGANPPNSC